MFLRWSSLETGSKVMIKSMRWRSVFVALMAVLLFIAPSWATACDIACTLHSVPSGCHASAADRSAQAIHSHCAGARGTAGSETVSVLSASAKSDCHHTFCLQSENYLVSVGHLQLSGIEWAVVSSDSVLETGFLSKQFVSEASPPLLDSIPNRAPLSLRI
jgi:hypothetical protein